MEHLLSARDSQGLPKEKGHFILRVLLPGSVFKFIILQGFNHHSLFSSFFFFFFLFFLFLKKKQLYWDTCHTSQQFKLYTSVGFGIFTELWIHWHNFRTFSSPPKETVPGIPWWSRGYDSMLPRQGVRSLGRDSDPIRQNNKNKPKTLYSLTVTPQFLQTLTPTTSPRQLTYLPVLNVSH